MKNQKKHNHVLKCFSRLLQYELHSLCSDNRDCILISHATDDMINFNCRKVICDAEQLAPNLLYNNIIIRQCMPANKKSNDSIAGLIISILLKQRRASASMFQRILSLILYSGHCTKKVMH